MWLPKDEILQIIVKKECKKFFQADQQTAKFSEENYWWVMELVKTQILRY